MENTGHFIAVEIVELVSDFQKIMYRMVYLESITYIALENGLIWRHALPALTLSFIYISMLHLFIWSLL